MTQNIYFEMAENFQIYHDALLQHGGAESVALSWASEMDKSLNVIAASKNHKSKLQNEINVLIPFIKSQKQLELLFPIIPLLLWNKLRKFENYKFLVSTTGVAHYLVNNKNTFILYVHSPTRWIWDKESFNIGRKKIEIYLANALRPLFKYLDIKKITTADLLIANSHHTKKRIMEIYRREAIVIHPPASKILTESQTPDMNLERFQFYLSIGRAKGYKGFDMLMNVANSAGKKIVFVGEGTENYNSEYVRGLGYVKETELKWLYENANALVAVSEEDFGLTPIEAAFHGCPTIAFGNKGYLDSVKNGISGLHIQNKDLKSLAEHLMNFNRLDFDIIQLQNFANNFTLSKHIKKLQEIINEK